MFTTFDIVNRISNCDSLYEKIRFNAGVWVVSWFQNQQNRVEIDYLHDDGGPVIFKWHFPKGTLSKRMSALELGTFVLSHMPAMTPLLAYHPRVQSEFLAILQKLALGSKDVVDSVVPWIKSITRTEEDDIISMDLREKNPGSIGPTYFIL